MARLQRLAFVAMFAAALARATLEWARCAMFCDLTN